MKWHRAVPHQEYALTYNESGSLVSDAGRNIANIEYDKMNNPVRIQFTNGNVTKYVYSAAGEKLRVIYQTAVPNITVATGSTRELTPSETLYTDSIDYLLGGALTLRNGRIDKFQFDEGYCQAEAYTSTKDDFTFCYYDKDHLGNVRQVTELDGTSKGSVIQRNNYYPFGAEFCDGNADNSVQSHKYNGKEFDNMHGLNTYDYGARQYNPVTARWDRMDPLAEKYPNVSPYVYCMNNPVRFVDPDGEDPIEALTTAVTTFIIDVGIDFFSSYFTNGFDREKAAMNINFKEATCDAVSAGLTSAFFSGAGISSLTAKLFKTKICGVNLGSVISATAENMIASVSSEFLKGSSFSEINFEKEFLKAAVGAVASYRSANKTETASGLYNDAASKANTAKNKLSRNQSANKNENRIKSDKNRAATTKSAANSCRNKYIKSKVTETGTSVMTQKITDKHFHKK